jgi:hypothetical protein
MKKFAHAWIAFKAVERLQNAVLDPKDQPYAKGLIDIFMNYRDGVIDGAWYPDLVFKDNGTSHIMKYSPVAGDAPAGSFPALQATSLLMQAGKASPLYGKAFKFDAKCNLPERCESLSHSVIDNLKIQDYEEKGSPLTPTSNHIALILFMLSHYIADAHMPMHCDKRPAELGTFDLHAAVEQKWEEEVVRFYDVDRDNARFRYTPEGFPRLRDNCPTNGPQYANSILKEVCDTLAARPFDLDYGAAELNSVLDYMHAVCRWSYLLAYAWLPAGFDPAALDHDSLELPGALPFRRMSVVALTEAVDAVARVWLRDIRRYSRWEKG